MACLDSISATPSLPTDELLAEALGATTEPEFDAITAAASRASGCGMAYVSLMKCGMLWFKSGDAFTLPPITVENSICANVLRDGAPLLLTDTLANPSFVDHPLVRAAPFIRFYAGVPLTVRNRRIGTLCVVDQEPRPAASDLLVELGGLGRVVEALVEARLAATQARDDASRLTLALAGRDRLHRQLQQAERLAGIGSWRLTVADGSLEYSDQVFTIHDLPIGETAALDEALDFYPEPDRTVLAGAIERAVNQGRPYDLELDFITAKGRLRRVRAIAEAELAGGRVIALVGVFQDVTERYQHQQALERAANTDDLTQLAGRRAFNAYLDTIIDVPSDKRSPIALVLVDLDHFKRANDGHGHAAGDEVLRQVARVLRSSWLAESFGARLGGDEFALVVTDPTLLADLDALTRRLLNELIIMVGTDEGSIAVSATIGVCHCWTGNASRRAMLEAADAALYGAKNERRGSAAIRRLGEAAARVA